MAAGGNSIPQLPPQLQGRNGLIAVGVVVAVILLIGAILYFTNTSKNLGNYKNLLKGIDQGRALEIAAQLKNKGLETQIIPSETGGVSIDVREKQYDDAVLEMAKSDLLLTDDFKLFDKSDWAASDYEKRIKYMRAVGGELSRLVSRMEGIRWGKVHVTIPPEKLFTSRYLKDKTSASVNVEMDPGRILTGSQVSSILSMVSGYVPEIEPNKISITDTKGRTYASAYGDEESTNGFANSNLSAQNQTVSSSIQKRVQDYLDSMLGSGKSNAAVSVKLASQKTTKNITTFSPGAIGTHEYSEEALGDAAAGTPYVGMAANQDAPPPRGFADPYAQSPGMDLVDPRLQKDMPNNRPAGQIQGDEKFQDPGRPNSGSQAYAYPDASRQPSPYSETNGLYAMGGNQGSSPQMSGAPPPSLDNTHYACAANDENCKRNYRKHNFAIQSYPSYEQTMIESPAGAVQDIKVSVVLEKGSLPVSINQLKAGIAAAADPSMDPNNVEVVLRPPMEDKSKKKASGFLSFGNSEDSSFQWWWIPLILITLLVVFLIFNAMRSLFAGKPKTFRDKVPFPSPSPSKNPTPSGSPFDRINNYEQRSQPPENIVQPATNYAPAPPQFDEEFEVEEPQPFKPTQENKSEQSSDLPFDLDDEFSEKQQEPSQAETKTVRQPNVKPQRQRPAVIIEDDSNAQ